MARVTGVGGVFLRSKDPQKLIAWYAAHLGVRLNAYGSASFEWTDEVPPGTGITAWSVFPLATEYFGEETTLGQQQTMINYRVDDLDGLLDKLSAAGIWIDPKRGDYDYGRFAWVRDCDGNRVELWEPLVLVEEKRREFLGY